MSCGIPATIRAPSGNSRRKARQPADAGCAERPRDEEALPALLERPRRGDQRAAPRRRLDDHGRVGEPADDPVAARERARGSARRRARARRRRAAGRDDRRRQPAWARGWRSPWPEPMTATVVPPARTAAACAAPSMPTASPDTTVAPTATRSAAIRAAMRRPASVARRVPTMATADPAPSAAGSPSTNRTCGGISIGSQPARVGGVLDRHDPQAERLGSARASLRRARPASAIAAASSIARPRGRRSSADAASSSGRLGQSLDPARRRGLARIARPVPYRRSSAPNPTGPRPCTAGQDGPGVALVGRSGVGPRPDDRGAVSLRRGRPADRPRPRRALS